MEKVADVIVVGYGLAGAVTAITAHDGGAQTLILEKQPHDHHWSNSSASAGSFISPSDVTGAMEFMEGLYRVDEDLCWTDGDTLKAWAEYSAGNRDWVERMGGNVKFLHKGSEHPEIPGSESIEVYAISGSGYRMMQLLYQQVSRRNIEVMYGAAARKLITDATGEIVGVRVQSAQTSEQNELIIKASKAVVLTCGGFEFNENMKLQYLRLHPVHFKGSPANTGDGISMALGVGSDLWHMNCCSASFASKFPGHPVAFAIDFGGKGRSWHKNERTANGFVVVDKHGLRFTAETSKAHCKYYELAVYDSWKRDYPRIPCYWIFDQKRMDTGPLPYLQSGSCGPLQLYEWSRDNGTELEKGWIISARNIRELARKIDVAPDVLDRTILNYNSYSQEGTDPEFGRRPADLAPLHSPPFYAVILWPGGMNTQGGPRRNGRAQILDTDGRPIPRLYSAGELGSVYGMLYPQAGGNLGECIAFGRISGENATLEKRL